MKNRNVRALPPPRSPRTTNERLAPDFPRPRVPHLKDRYGLSWQVVPAGMEELFSDPDPERAPRAMEAMLQMRKLDVAALQAAADGAATG